jgi:hypothetical protein
MGAAAVTDLDILTAVTILFILGMAAGALATILALAQSCA